MGTDCNLFAKNAKKWCAQDREYNLSADCDWNTDDEKFFGGTGVDATTAEFIILRSRHYWTDQGQVEERRVYWCDLAIRFIKAHPNDIFFVMNDLNQPEGLYGRMVTEDHSEEEWFRFYQECPKDEYNQYTEWEEEE